MTLKILTVDDSRMIRNIVKRTLKPYNVEVLEADDGAKGLSVASERRPDIIILDVAMPVMTGLEMLEKLKQQPNLKKIPVIMLTAESGKENVMKIIQMGASDYLLKPFKAETLMERIEKYAELSYKAEEASSKFFVPDGDFDIMKPPDKVTRPIMVEIEGEVEPQINRMKGSGRTRMIVDLTKTKEITVSLVKLLLLISEKCREAGIQVGIAGNPDVGKGLKGVEETREFLVYFGMDKAKEALAG